MNGVSFKSILTGAMALAGISPDVLPDRDRARARFCEFINERMREAWGYERWPELIRTGYFLFSDPVIGGSTVPSIPLSGEGRVSMETVLGVYDRDPRGGRASRLLRFSVVEGKIFVAWPNGSGTWVQFLPVFEPYSVEPVWSAAKAYAAGDLVFDEGGTGDCFSCVADAPAGVAITDGAHWRRLLVPESLAPYVKQAAFADILTEDGQFEPGGRQLSRAKQMLLDLADKATAGQGQFQTVGVSIC
ncbi:MAG: hypothetical protein LBK99_05720 [Opitutaceae bacterium]|nr:hypothetical protein [Opitutaceae bacterium]